MPNRSLRTSFNAGEFSPQMYGRYDFSKYKNGCKTLYNAVCLPHGGATRRPGTKYIAEVGDSERPARLIPFKFSESQSYILEFGHNTIRVYYEDAPLYGEDSNTVLLLHMNGNYGETDYTDDGATGHTVTANNGPYILVKNNKFPVGHGRFWEPSSQFLSVPDHADWNFGTGAWCIDFWYRPFAAPSESTWKDYTFWCQSTDQNNYHKLWYDESAEKVKYTIVASGTPETRLEYTWAKTDMIFSNGWVHIAVIDNWAGNSSQQALCINGTAQDTYTSGVLTIPDYTGQFWIGKGEDGAGGYDYLDGNIDEFRVSKGASRWTANFTPPTVPYPFNGTGGGMDAVLEVSTSYAAEDVFDLQYVQSADVMYITHADYATQTLTRNSHTSWTLASVSFTAAPATWASAGYPYTVCFFQDRLCFGGSPGAPDTIWLSKTADYDNFTTGSNDDDSLSITLNSREVNRITWMARSRRLLVGTLSGEWWISGPSDQEPATPSDYQTDEDSSWGSQPVRPVKSDNSIFFIQRKSSTLREQSYEFSDDRYVSVNSGILAEHFFRDREIYQMDYQQVPYSIIWLIRDDGVALGFTYMREHEVFGWHEHVTDGEFESVAVVAGPEEDAVYFIVKRTIDGSDVRYVEKMMPFEYGSSLSEAFFVDCGIEEDNPATGVCNGLDHLEGETVDVLGDGVVLDDETVSSGAITASDTGISKAIIGLNYVTDIETLDATIEDDQGFLSGVVKRITNIMVRLYDTVHGYYGKDSSNLIAIKDTTGDTAYNGWTSDLSFDEGDDKEATVYLRQNEPLPFTVLAINHEFEED